MIYLILHKYSINEQILLQKEINRPWREILKSSHFWAVTGVHVASNALFIFFITYVPAYLMMYGLSLEDVSTNYKIFIG